MSSTTRRNRIFLAGALTVSAVAFLAITLGGIGDNLVYYWGPAELRAAGDKAVGASIRLGGQVVPGSVNRGGGSNLEFDVTDGKEKVRVISRGVPPQMFREGIGVVVEGTMTSGNVFTSDRLMVSHSNEYKAPKEGDSSDVKELIGSTEGLKESGSPR